MRRIMLALAAALVLACGAAAPREEVVHTTTTTDSTATTTGSTTTTTGTTPARNGNCVTPCTENAECVDARGWNCTCTWLADTYCGGAWRPPMPPALDLTCTPPDPTADRGDGCPYAAPTDQSACSGAHQCQYPIGCTSVVSAECTSGRWSVHSYDVPPMP